MEPVNLMLDTDIGEDCDDSGALAIANELMKEGLCRLLSVTHCFRGPYYAGCIDAINRHYGHPDIPIGVFAPDSGAASGPSDVYARATAERFPHRFAGGAPCPGTVEVMRRALANAPDGSVTLAVIGCLHSCRRLLESGPDNISPLSGSELARQKLRRTVVMGGRFHQAWPEPIVWPDGAVLDAEYNIRSDVPSAQYVCRHWPGELVFCSYEIGGALITGARLQAEGYPQNPVSFCYHTWHARAGLNAQGRESWDLATVLYAIRPELGLWRPHEYGEVRVDDAGVTTWRPTPGGRHAYLLPAASEADQRRALDDILERDLLRMHDA